MKLKLYCSSRYIPDQRIEGRRWAILQYYNTGFHLVPYCIWLLKQNGVSIEMVDTAGMLEEDRKAIYESVIPLAESEKHSIRRVFGTKHRSGVRFGVEVPALLVYDGTELIDIYPRETSKIRRYILNRNTTIIHFLLTLMNKNDSININKNQIKRITTDVGLRIITSKEDIKILLGQSRQEI